MPTYVCWPRIELSVPTPMGTRSDIYILYIYYIIYSLLCCGGVLWGSLMS